jgi:MATE family multidrug resistance protein
MLSVGLSIAASIRVGNCLGEGNAIGAKTTASLAVQASMFLGASSGMVYLLLRQYVVRPFTTDSDVRALAADAIYVVSLFQLADSVQAACTGILRGSGHQSLGSWVNFFGYVRGALSFVRGCMRCAS